MSNIFYCVNFLSTKKYYLFWKQMLVNLII